MKYHKRYIFHIIYVAIFLADISHAQNNATKLNSTTETIKRYGDIIDLDIIGKLAYVGFDSILLYDYQRNGKALSFYAIDERDYAIKKIYNQFDNKGQRLYGLQGTDSMLFYTKTYFTTPDMRDDGYTILEFWYQKQTLRLDSLHYADKWIDANFSTDGKHLLVSTLHELRDYYEPDIDNRIYVYSIDSLKKGSVYRQTIPCHLCADSYLIGDQLFFTKSNVPDDLWGGYADPDVYVAPWGRIQDSVKVVASSDIVAISPDGKFVLARRRDIANGALAIVNVAQKKYQLLLGRKYQRYSQKPFYSHLYQKFAFIMDDHIVYVDFPEEYPFDALQRDNPLVPFDLDLTPYQHPPLK